MISKVHFGEGKHGKRKSGRLTKLCGAAKRGTVQKSKEVMKIMGDREK